MIFTEDFKTLDLQTNSSDSKHRRRKKRGHFPFQTPNLSTCEFHLSYDINKISGMHFGIEDLSLDTEKSCREFIEVRKSK